MTFSYLRPLLLAAFTCVVFAMAPGAQAQTSETSASTVDRAKNNWSVNCGAGDTAEAPLVCQMMQNVVVAETNQRLLTVMVRPQQDVANHMLTLALPHGVDFGKGVDVQVDDKGAINVPVQTSNPQGAFSNLPISNELLADFRAGNTVKITFHAVSGQTFSVPISLIGFSNAYDKLAED